MNIPTKLTVSRIVMIPLFIAVYFLPIIPGNLLIASGIFAIASFTDFLDGYIARKYNMVTDLGKFLDPIADKVLVLSAFVVMLVPTNGDLCLLPWYGSIGIIIIITRELIVATFRMVAASKGKVLAADFSGKLKTFTQDIAILFIMTVFGVLEIVQVSSVLGDVLKWIGYGIFWLSVLLTIISGTECLVKNANIVKANK